MLVKYGFPTVATRPLNRSDLFTRGITIRLKMKSSVICALALIALVNGETAEIHVESNSGTQLEDADLHGSVENLRICEPGATKMEDCNNCFCIVDGSGWACTKIGCYHAPINTGNDPEEEIQAKPSSGNEEETCVPGSTKRVDCNTCFCSEARWACTEIGCLHSEFNPSDTKGDIAAL